MCLPSLRNILLKTVGGADYTNSLPCNAKKLPKMTKFKRHNSVKIDSTPLKPHAHLQYIHNMSAKFGKHLLKTVREVDYTNLPTHYNQKKLPKITKLKGPYSCQNSIYLH